jgi:dihydroorotate dehydrogenase
MIGNIQGFSIEEYATLLEAVEPHVDAIEMSMLCPNVVDKEFGLLTPAPFSEFVAAVAKSNSKPWFVKLPSYEDDEDRKRILQLAEIAAAGGAAGITVSGAFVQPDKRLSIGRGNVTGTPALGRTLTFVSDLYRATGGLPIKALGGITSGADAFRAIGAGASVVELYTSFIYRGPNVAGYITEELRKILDERGIGSIEELRGTALT